MSTLAPRSNTGFSGVTTNYEPPSSGNSAFPLRQTNPKHSTRSRQWQDTRTLLILLSVLSITVTIQLVAIEYFFFGTPATLEPIDPQLIQYVRQPESVSNPQQQPLEHSSLGIRSLDEILMKAGVNVTSEISASLPPPSEAERMYGSQPVILGLDRCETFQKTVPGDDAYIGPAGMFNTGTNLMTELLKKNCHIPDRMKNKNCRNKKCPGMREQVPWGKHTPVSWRNHHTAKQGGEIIHNHILPIVVVKDPYTWMTSMCRHTYAARWFHGPEHCPNLIPITENEKRLLKGSSSVPVTINYSLENQTHHESLVGLWNDWYDGWFKAEFPRLIVRFEDLMFWTEEIVTKACECGGGKLLTGAVEYIADSAKASKGKVHAGSSGLVEALKRYSNETLRREPFQHEDLEYAKQNLNEELMAAFVYKKIEP